MTIRLTHLSLIAALAASPALAQDDGAADTATEDTPAVAAQADDAGTTAEAGADAGTESEAEDGAPATNEADMGLQPTQSQSAQSGQSEGPQAFVKSEEGDWQVQCVRFPDGTEAQCQLFQLLNASDDNPIAETFFFKPPEGSQFEAGLNILVPLRTLLTQPLSISIDGGQARQIPYMMCTGEGCVARAGISSQELNLFKRGASAEVTIIPADAPDERVVAEMSLSGFTAGFESLTPMQQPRAPQQ
jgi:invasion protein IalB